MTADSAKISKCLLIQHGYKSAQNSHGYIILECKHW